MSNSYNPRELAKQAEELFSQEKYDEIIALINHDLLAELKDAELNNWKGLAHTMKHEYDEAIKNFDEAIKLRPDYALAWNNRGNAWSDKGDLDQAIFNYDETIKLRPDYAWAWYNRGRSWNDKNDLDQAIFNYDEAIKLEPKDASAWNNRGNAWSDKGDLDQAIFNYDEAIKLKPKDAFAWYNRGHSWYEKGDLGQAIFNYDEAIRLIPGYALAWFNRGNAWHDKGDLGQAIFNYDEAIRLNPSYASAWFNRGNTWYKKGDLGQAIINYDEAIRLRPDYSMALFSRAILKKENPFYGIASIDLVNAAQGFLKTARFDRREFRTLTRLIEEIHYSHPLLCQEIIDAFIPVQSLLGVNNIYSEVETRTNHVSRWLKVLDSTIEVSDEYQRNMMEAIIAYHAGNPVRCFEITDKIDDGLNDLQHQYYFLISSLESLPDVPFRTDLDETKEWAVKKALLAIEQPDIDEEELHYAMLILFECGRYEVVANIAGLVRSKSTKYLAVAAIEKLNDRAVAQRVFDEIRNSELYQDYDLPTKKIEIKAPRIQEDVSELIKENQENVKKKLDVKKELPELIKDEIERNTLQRKEQLTRLIRYYEIEAAVNPYLASGEEVLRFCDVIRTNKLWQVMRYKEKMDTGDFLLGKAGTKAKQTMNSTLSDFDFHDGIGELGLRLSENFIQLKSANSNEQFMKLFGVIIRSRTFDLSIILKFIKYFYLDGKFDEKELVYLFLYAINYQPIKFTLITDSMKDITKSGVKSGIAELQDLLEWTSELTTTIASPFLAKYIEGFIKISNKGSDSGGQLDYNTFKMNFAAYIANQLEEFGENSQEYKILNQFDSAIGN